jgi:hypothetical protein
VSTPIICSLTVERVLMSWDAALREEVLDFTAMLSDDPASVLMPANANAAGNTWIGRFRSQVDPAMTVTLALISLLPENDAWMVVSVTHTRDATDDEEDR